MNLSLSCLATLITFVIKKNRGGGGGQVAVKHKHPQ